VRNGSFLFRTEKNRQARQGKASGMVWPPPQRDLVHRDNRL
jgi:hypothetical protein